MHQQAMNDLPGTIPGWLLQRGPFVITWAISRLFPKPPGGVGAAAYIGAGQSDAGWTACEANADDGFLDIHSRFAGEDGLIYLACQLTVETAGEWELALGHDGGVRLFVEGREVLTEPALRNPAVPGRSCVRVALSPGQHEIVVAFDLAAGAGWGIILQASRVEPRPEPVIISDLSVCSPAAGLAERHQRGHWKVVPYTTTTFSGNSLWALKNSGAPEVTLPLNATGWHAVYLGLSNGGMPVAANQNVVRVKLSGDAAFQHRSQTQGRCEEVFFTCADLTGQSLHIAQQTEGYPRAACVCYVKLVPLTEKEVQALRDDRRQQDTRRLIGTIDGYSFLYERRPTTEAELLEEFEPFRHTDFGTIWWQYTGADLVNYRSRLGTIPGEHTDTFPDKGCGYFTESVQTLIDRGIDLTKVAVQACHERGMAIHIGMRPAAWKFELSYEDYFISDFYRAHPEWRCCDRDGTPVTRMSFAVPEVRQHLLGIFREVLEAEPDGLNILYHRGFPLLLWEDAFRARFMDVYGEEARAVPEDDPRLYDLRAEILTEWMREVRQLLDAFQRERGLAKRLALSMTCLETAADNRKFGIDVARWAREGLIDQLGVIQWPGAPIELDWLQCAVAGTQVSLHPGVVTWKQTDAGALLQQAKAWDDAGANGLLFWDPSAKVPDGLFWPIISRLGHTAETRARLAAGKPGPLITFISEMGDEPTSRWLAQAGF